MTSLLESLQDIRDVARRFLADTYPPDRVRASMEADWDPAQDGWNEIADLGWSGVGLDEELGGVGQGAVARCLLLEEMGRVLAPIPFLSSAVLTRDLLAATQGTPEGAQLLRRIAEGSVRGAAVVAGDLHGRASAMPRLLAEGGGTGIQITGDGGVTLDGGTADVLVVVAALADGSRGVFQVDASAPGVRRVPVPMMDQTRRFAAVTLEAAPALRLDHHRDAEPDVRRALDHSLVALTAEMVGGAQRCVEMTVEYVKQREQFGVAIGTFQAIKHRLADLSISVDGAREMVLQAAELIDAGVGADALAVAAAAAKVAAADAYDAATSETIQLHGGIGFTWEHPAHLYFKRARVSTALLGEPRVHRARLGWERDADHSSGHTGVDGAVEAPDRRRPVPM